MFRTCGITQFELKGKGAHNLQTLLRNIESNEENWPVSKDDLMWLSSAYFDARYPMGTLPWKIDCCDKSKQAREINKKMKKWVLTNTSVSMPDSNQSEVINDRIIKSELTQILTHSAPIKGIDQSFIYPQKLPMLSENEENNYQGIRSRQPSPEQQDNLKEMSKGKMNN